MATYATQELQWSGHTWTTYSGTGALGQLWTPDLVRVRAKGTLVLAVESGKAGAIGDQTPHLYGHWAVRFKMSAGAGAKYAILLSDKPHGNEIDFAEGMKGGDDQRRMLTTSVGRPRLAVEGEGDLAIQARSYAPGPICYLEVESITP